MEKREGKSKGGGESETLKLKRENQREKKKWCPFYIRKFKKNKEEDQRNAFKVRYIYTKKPLRERVKKGRERGSENNPRAM